MENSPSHWGRKRNRHLEVSNLPFLFELGKNGEVHPNRPMKNKRRAKVGWNEGARSTFGRRTKKKKCGVEGDELIPFPFWAQSSAVFPLTIKDLGLLATLFNQSIFFI